MTHVPGNEQADKLDRLADEVRRLSIDRRDPERFHLDRDDAAKAMRRLAREMRQA